MDNNPIQTTDNDQISYLNQAPNNPSVQLQNRVIDCYGMPIIHKPQSDKPKYQQANPLIAFSISIAASLLIASILYLINNKTISIADTSKAIPMLVLPLFSMAGFAIEIGTFLNEKKNKERCTQSVIGKCIKMDKKIRRELDGDFRASYIPTYIYEASGQNHTIISRDSYSWLFKPSIGSNRQILLNPDDSDDAFIPQSTMQKITTTTFCIGLVIGSFILFYYYISK